MSETFKEFSKKPWLLSLTAGVLLGLAWPPVNLPILQFPAFLLLFMLLKHCRTVREVILYTYPGLILWNTITTYWLVMATLTGGIAAILANSLLMLIPLLWIRKLMHSSAQAFWFAPVAAAVWTSYEFLHHRWDLAWNWLALGNGWAELPYLVHYISWTGYLGISFWIVLTSAFLWQAVRQPVPRRLYMLLASILIFPLLSMLAMNTTPNPESPHPPIEVAVIQPNLDSYIDLGGFENADEVVTSLLEQTNVVRTRNTRLILWPENALESVVTLDSRHVDRIRDSVRVWNSTLITGSGYLQTYEERVPKVVRGYRNGVPWNVYNAALHFSPDGQVSVYKKGRLVPVVERLPFAEFFQGLDRAGWVDWGSLTGYGRGEEAVNFPVGPLYTPALICYDSVFPEWVREFVTGGADFLTIITNDGWWGYTSGHIQHFAFARLRAIETQRWIARSANNGISGIIGPDGTIHRKTDYWVQDAFTATIEPNSRLTPYMRFGDWFNLLVLALALLGSLIPAFRKTDSNA
ncbi:MAG: apolipoprotein N-acyltransferase [Balneolaceae bacterium]